MKRETLAIFMAFALITPVLAEPSSEVLQHEALTYMPLLQSRTDVVSYHYRAAGDYTLRSRPSISAAEIDDILTSYKSPAQGTGQVWYNLGIEYRIDPAFALAFFIHESTAGANPQWAGHKPDGSTTHNIGNLACGDFHTCYGRWRDYDSWEEGIRDWYRVMNEVYVQHGYDTVHKVIPSYAPSNENNVRRFIQNITWLVDKWRTE